MNSSGAQAQREGEGSESAVSSLGDCIAGGEYCRKSTREKDEELGIENDGGEDQAVIVWTRDEGE